MVKFLAGVIYVLAMGLALKVGYDHTLSADWPMLSGFVGLAIMTVLPQMAIATVFYAFHREPVNHFDRIRR